MTASLNRTLSFFSTWLAEVLRQPWLMLSLVVGPFLILLLFGQGVRQGVPEPRTLLVVPERQGAQQRIDPLPADLRQHLDIVGQTTSLDEARRRLRDGDVDLVAVLPPAPLEAIKAGKHAPVRILTNEIDPVLKTYTRTYLNDQIGVLNRQTVEKAIADAQRSLRQIEASISQAGQSLQALRASQGDPARSRQAVSDLKAAVDQLPGVAASAVAAAYGVSFVIPGLDQSNDAPQRLAQAVDSLKRATDRVEARSTSASGGSAFPSAEDVAAVEDALNELDAARKQARSIPPEVLAAPFALDVEDVAPFVPSYIGFYAPAVLVLLLQHLGVTLGALSMARIRLLGLMELLQTAPVRPAEVVVGNYLSYGLLSAIAGGILLALLTTLLGVPVFGSWVVVAGTLLLLAASLGIGFIISMLSASEQQAAQIAMLVLIASVFFSGFIVAVTTLVWPMRALSYTLPATYAIRTLQDVMLRGVLRRPLDLVILGAASVGLFLVTVRLFQREYRPR